MLVRTYEFYKVGYKDAKETEYTFYNEPFLVAADAAAKARRICIGAHTQTCVARFQIIEVNKAEEGDDFTPAEKMAMKLEQGKTYGTFK